MLAYILAVLVGSGSVGLYIAAFFYPEIHRKQDFIWSGVGCFYALFLWVYAHQVTGGILVGQTTSVILLGWFAWQTFQLRRQLAPIDRDAAIANAVQLPNRKGTTKSASPKPTSPTSATIPSATTVSTPPAAKVKQSIEKPATPVATKPASNQRSTTPVDTIKQSIDRPAPAPDSISLADVKIPPASVKATPPVSDRQVASSPQPLPQTTPSPEAEEDRAWIKLEVKPASARSKPLGTPAQPPTPLLAAATNPEEIAKSTQSLPQIDSNSNIQSDSISTAKIELEEPN